MSRDVDHTRLAWRVTIPGHTIPRGSLGGGYLLPAFEQVRFEDDRDIAIAMAVQALHVAEGIPPWRSFRRRSCEVASAERCREVAAAGRA